LIISFIIYNNGLWKKEKALSTTAKEATAETTIHKGRTQEAPALTTTVIRATTIGEELANHRS